MKAPIIAVLSCGLAVLACRERYPETPRLAEARDRMAKAPAQGGMTRVSEAPAEFAERLKGGELVFSDDFEREVPGDKWKVETEHWKLVGGQVTNKQADNAGFWLLEPLPDGDLRIEFDVRSDSYTVREQGETKEVFPGDLKCEAFNESPEHQTGYVFIFGGWSNTVNRIARLEEHGAGPGARVADGPTHPVKAGHTYRMKVVRLGGTIAWYADDKYLVHMADPEPIAGKHFGFNNWRSHLTFDNVAVYALAAEPAPTRETPSPTRRSPAPGK